MKMERQTRSQRRQQRSQIKSVESELQNLKTCKNMVAGVLLLSYFLVIGSLTALVTLLHKH